VTIFMSSHNLGEVSRLAHRIGIIHEGRLIQELDVAELQRNRRRRLAIGVRDTEGARAALVDAGLDATVASNGTIETRDETAIDQPDEIAARLVHAGHPPTMLVVEQESLEDYFMRLVGMDGGNGK
jgi:ABC-2 type transport system ATP-binding protein